MKKLFIFTTYVLLVAVLLFSFAGCNQSNEQLLNKYSKQIDQEMRGCFDFFWNEAQTNDGSPAYGLIADRAGGTKDSAASIASVGFGLAAYVVGAEEGYVTRQEAQERTLGTLQTLRNLQTNGSKATYKGFFTHFLNMTTAQPVSGSEISSIDTAIMLCGALTAGEYFEGDVKELADDIYSEVDWTAMQMTRNGKHYISMTVDKNNKPITPWDYYAEQLMIYVLGAGSPTEEYRLDDTEYYDFTRNKGTYGGHSFYHSWFGSIFTYQFSHAFVDFRNKVDKNGDNWWDNSVEASLAAYQYCKDNASKSKSYAAGGWGLTACDVPNGYSGFLGAPPRGWEPDSSYRNIEGTIAPCGAIGSVVFTPAQSLKTLNYYQTNSTLRFINGKYGLLDAYNLDKDWYALDYIGIDKGISLLMLYNFKCDGVWNLFMANNNVQNGMEVLGFIAE